MAGKKSEKKSDSKPTTKAGMMGKSQKKLSNEPPKENAESRLQDVPKTSKNSAEGNGGEPLH